MSNTLESYATSHKPTWCPGCGDFGIWMAVKSALAKLSYAPSDVAIVYGIGCHGNMNNTMQTYGITGLHGRGIPVACGLKYANPQLPVICIMGDGDCLGEGGNHFLHAARRNPDITVIIHDNQVYGLTTGQASPTAQKGLKTKSTPAGAVEEPINPLALGLVSGATFAARGFAGDIPGLTDSIVSAIKHKGFSIVDVLQPCVTFNPQFSYAWYREHIYQLDAGHNRGDQTAALLKAREWQPQIPLGIFYDIEKPTSEEIEAPKPGEADTGISKLEDVLNDFV